MKKSTRANLVVSLLIIFLGSRAWTFAESYMRLKRVRDRYSKRIYFSGQEMDYNGAVYKGESLTVAYSGLRMDFRGAKIVETALLDLYAEYSGIQIIVPKKWRVSIEGSSKMSGIANKAQYNKHNKNGPLLVIKHDLRYTGLDVTYAEALEDLDDSDILRHHDKKRKKNHNKK